MSWVNLKTLWYWFWSNFPRFMNCQEFKAIEPVNLILSKYCFRFNFVNNIVIWEFYFFFEPSNVGINTICKLAPARRRKKSLSIQLSQGYWWHNDRRRCLLQARKIYACRIGRRRDISIIKTLTIITIKRAVARGFSFPWN